MNEIVAAIGRVASGELLDRGQSTAVFTAITGGEATPAQIGALLMGLRVRGETEDEMVGAVHALRARMHRVSAPEGAMDVVGTGGDGLASYNISTCTALVVAGAGVPVAKHGNRALSSMSGAADVLTALGVRVGLDPAGVEHCLRHGGIGFMFAPAHHPALRHVAAARAELGTRTVFNLLGPLLNPAGVRRHLVGVYSSQWLEPMARVLGELGSRTAWVVHGADGLDEISTTGPTAVAELRDGRVRTFEISPRALGLRTMPLARLRGGTPGQNALAVRSVLRGEPGAYRDVVVLNAAAALVVADRCPGLREGMVLAAQTIDSGAAAACLEALVKASVQADETNGVDGVDGTIGDGPKEAVA
ncbi:anthranilate phosphoribosyltransferase [Kineosporia mesophila]|uniref:Anthranilate phosphoribosyltransferase n=1 Tax=Kineosporia mesophila TaxID=566012 RepID=A0ABP7AAW5_9ACTN|nr:anthranilate phosphoribosyltransferase [Kineosporia mesophila]